MRHRLASPWQSSPPRHGRPRLIGLVILTATTLAIGAGFLLLSPHVDAKPQFMSLFGRAYPAAAGTALDSCVLCHTNPSHPDEENLNRYGRDWEDGDIGDRKFLAPALVRRDSDGDGVPNGQEIDQLSFPGDASSSTTPTTTTTIPGTPPNGQALFASGCAICHGSGGGNLTGTTLGRSKFVSIVRNGRGSMPAQSGISKEEAGAIWGYLTGAAPVTTTTTLPGATTTTTTPATGSAIWAANCAACHGPNGGNVVPTTSSTSQLTSIITNGKGSMPGFANLGAAQIANVAAYLKSFSTSTTTTTLPGATTTTTTPATGSAVWAANCAACHGPNGGNLQGNSLSLSRITSITSGGIGSMPGFSSRLSSAEIANVSAYVLAVGTGTGTTSTVTTTPPATAVSSETLFMQACSSCHGIHGEGGIGGPVAGTSLDRSQVITLIGSGSGAMPEFGTVLSAGDIEAIADHVLGIAGDTGAGAVQGTELPPPTLESLGTTDPDATPPAGAAPSTDGTGHLAAPVAPPAHSSGGSTLLAALLGALGMAALILGPRALRTLAKWSWND